MPMNGGVLFVALGMGIALMIGTGWNARDKRMIIG